jgi:hypothetical protein
VAGGLYLCSLALTTGALMGARLIDVTSLALALALVAVTAANAVAAVVRFAVLRAWVFRPAPTHPNVAAEASS